MREPESRLKGIPGAGAPSARAPLRYSGVAMSSAAATEHAPINWVTTLMFVLAQVFGRGGAER